MARKKSAPNKVKASPPTTVYQLKVTLEGSKPTIWRRLLVPGVLTLGDLHYVLQIAIGWTDSHLHQFRVGETNYGPPDADMDWMLDEEEITLDKLIPAEKFKFRYEYDFGDSWSHLILVEKILPAEPGRAYPSCIKGKMACPPEDCGGIWGYADFVDAIGDPNHPEHKNIKEWYEGDFDPEAFDIDEINAMLTAPG